MLSTLTRSTLSMADEFPVGSLVRVKLKDFMTYNFIELNLGPVRDDWLFWILQIIITRCRISISVCYLLIIHVPYILYFHTVLGPNGSGKSSIVAAICLGLGGSPQVWWVYMRLYYIIAQIMSRSPKISSFVRHGCRKGIVEIEVKAERGTHVIRRILASDNEKSQVNICVCVQYNHK